MASAIGLRSVFAHSQPAYYILKLVGVTFLRSLALQTLFGLRNDLGRFDYGSHATVRPLAAFRLGLVTNLTNRKAAAFAIDLVPQFVPRDFSLVTGVSTLARVQSFVATCWYLTLVTSVTRAPVVLARPPVRR